MKLFVISIVFAASAGAEIISTKPGTVSDQWEKQHVTPYFWGEGACAADVNGDGEMDVLYGPYWFQGPDFKKAHTIYPADETFESDGKRHEGFQGALGKENAYSNNFLTYIHDMNGNGRPDYIVCGMPGEESYWYENPGGTGELWKRHLIMPVTDNESPMFVDVNGDGQPDLLCMTQGTIGYASYDAKNPTAEWKWHAISEENHASYQRYTHGIGYGDINGDGRIDILEADGWWEQPAEWDGKTPWVRHDVDFGRGGAQMYGYDVNGDGRTDVITSLSAHEFGLAWFEQNKDGSFTRHLLTGIPGEKGSTGVTFSQPHAIDLVDMNGDGLLDIVTGKRFWAHGPDGDPEPNEAAVLYVFYLTQKDGKAEYRAELIDDDSGVGCQILAIDINKDGKPDIVTGNKKGCFIHVQK